MNKRQYKKLVKRNALKIVRFTEKEMYKIMKEFARGIKEGIESRLAESIETALKMAEGLVIINVVGQEDILFSEHFACPDCGISIDELAPRLFSFNSPWGKCEKCDGLGTLMEFDPDLIIPDKSLSIMEGAIATWGEGRLKEDSWTFAILKALSAEVSAFDPINLLN